MEKLKTFRHEFKYAMSYDEMLKLRSELDKVLELDRGHPYMLRSLYFDTYDDEDYYEKQNGALNRKKVRIRIYDSKDDWAKIEIKAKYDIHQLKESLVISKDDAINIIDGNYDVLSKYDDELAQKIYRLLMDSGYRPKVIIEYLRAAYVTKLNNRITFDFDIKRSEDFDKFYTEDINYLTVSDPKEVVLEVKFDRFLEPHISKILSKYINRNQSVSKYVLGRNF